MQKGYSSLLNRQVKTKASKKEGNWLSGEKLFDKAMYTKSGRLHPKLITLGGDHTLVLPVLRSLHSVYGPVSVIHFDSHLDSWDPGFYGGDEASKASTINHGTFFWHAANEGLIRNGSSVHAGIRTRLAHPSDYETDQKVGFSLQEAHIIVSTIDDEHRDDKIAD